MNTKNTKSNNKAIFKKQKYVKVDSGLTSETIDLITQYALFDEMQRYTPEGSELNRNNQVPGAHSRYADPMMESLLSYLQPVVEKNTGLSLYPTYSYYRVYRPGDELKPHKDRPACEISITISFKFDYLNKKYDWPIFVDNNAINMNPGEMVIYRGCELEHWREKFEAEDGSWHVQAFLHYVDANGENANQKWDGRSSLGSIIDRSGNVAAPVSLNQSVKKSYIEFTK